MENHVKKKKLSLGSKILVGFLIGIMLGFLSRFLFGAEAAAITTTYITPFSTLFLNLIRMVCVPLVFSSLVVGACSTGDMKSMGRIGGKTLGYFLCSGAVGGAIALVLANVIRLGADMGISTQGLTYTPAEGQSVVDTLLNIIPTNPFASLSSGTMLQIIFFALALGLGINMIGQDGERVKELFVAFTDIMCKLTGLIMFYAPVAVCAMMISTIAGYGIDVLKQYAIVCIAIYAGCLIHILVIYFPTLAVLCRYSIRKFVKTCFPSFFVAFSTMSSNAALPVTMENTEELGVPNHIKSFVVPLGCTIHMDGTIIYQAILTVFIANVYGMPLDLSQ